MNATHSKVNSEQAAQVAGDAKTTVMLQSISVTRRLHRQVDGEIWIIDGRSLAGESEFGVGEMMILFDPVNGHNRICCSIDHSYDLSFDEEHAFDMFASELSDLDVNSGMMHITWRSGCADWDWE